MSARRGWLILPAALFAADHLFIAVGLKLGGLYLTSGTARFQAKTLLPLYALACLTAALLLGLVLRGPLWRRLERRLGALATAGLVSAVEALLLIARYHAVGRDVDGIDRLYVIVLLPTAGALAANALFLVTRTLVAPARLEGVTWFVERHVLGEVRLSFLPIGYIVTGAPWVYPFRLACRLVPATLLMAWWLRGRRHERRLEST